jgi:hypothetical protein
MTENALYLPLLLIGLYAACGTPPAEEGRASARHKVDAGQSYSVTETSADRGATGPCRELKHGRVCKEADGTWKGR